MEAALAALLERGAPFDYAAVKALAAPDEPVIPVVAIGEPDLAAYDALLAGGAR